GGDKFKVVDAEFNMSGNGCTVTRMKIIDGYDAENVVLVARNSKNVITALLAELKDWNKDDQLLLDMLDGIYTDSQGKEYNFARESLNGEKFEVQVSDGNMAQCFKLNDGKIYWVEFTDKGIDLYNAVWDDDNPVGYYKQSTFYKSLTKKDQITEILTGQYPYTSMKLVLPSELDYFSKAQLRVMRNEIYARHGYVFSSADLKAHFAKMSWYKPLNDNSKVQLSELEQLNVDLIKAWENKSE
ncbi:MAG: YARHG domain-containing protein, partial [Bacteroidales bacterium]|nr:YARHG domain-containing protein [Bacteroidales bacterium]